MARAQNPNIQILERAAERLEELVEELVFLGGCATGLLITDPAAPPIRVTRDVDVITELATLSEYHHLSKRLRRKGFSEDQSPDAPICRWLAPGLILDVMPTDEKILGFGNEWYRPALTAAKETPLPSGQKIRMVTAPYFLATKLLAFDGRGNCDFVMSHDIEDFVAVLDGRPTLPQEVAHSDARLRNFLVKRLTNLLTKDEFLNALPGHVQDASTSPERSAVVLEKIREISALG